MNMIEVVLKIEGRGYFSQRDPLVGEILGQGGPGYQAWGGEYKKRGMRASKSEDALLEDLEDAHCILWIKRNITRAFYIGRRVFVLLFDGEVVPGLFGSWLALMFSK